MVDPQRRKKVGHGYSCSETPLKEDNSSKAKWERQKQKCRIFQRCCFQGCFIGGLQVGMELSRTVLQTSPVVLL